MTDNEIIKALERCRYHRECCFCNSVEECGNKKNLTISALDLINRQKAEKENLEIEIQAMRNAANGYKAEVERVQAKYDNMQIGYDLAVAERNANMRSFREICKQLKTAKAEAVKEFAERLKEEIDCDVHTSEGFYFMVQDAIDNLVKETVGDADDK
jgi:hypothetical protein